MENPITSLGRRQFLAQSTAAAGALLIAGRSEAAPASENPLPICAFVKFVQQLSFDELAEKIAGMGFNGIEATVRAKGQILPAEVEEQLPKLVEALKKHGLEITIMTTDVNRADHPLTEKVLRTASSLGIKRYRMNYYRYNLGEPIWPQLLELQPVVRDLAALNKELGITGLYQNHAGPAYVGAGIWDLHHLLQDIPKEQMAIGYDIRHATMEGGSSWQATWNLMQPHLGAVFAKDCLWEGRKVEEVPLGKGIVDPAFFAMVTKSGFPGPVTLHVEYLQKEGLEPNLEALRTDLKTLREMLASKNTKAIAR